MKISTQNLILIISITSFIHIGCGQASQNPAGKKEAVEVPKAPVEDPLTTEAKNQAAALEKLSPYTFDQLLKILPPKLFYADATDIGARENLGAAFASARYAINDSSEISIEIFDCAGTEGAGVYKQQYLSLFLPDNSANGKTLKRGTYQGSPSFEEYIQSEKEYLYSFLGKKRLLVSMTGKRVDVNLLKEAADQLHYPD